MATINTNVGRVSNALRTSVVTQGLASTQAQLLQVQNQLTTSQKISTPSEDPGSASVIMQLQKTLENRQAYLGNISKAQDQLNQADATIGDIQDKIQNAISVASANVGSDVTAQQQTDASAVVQSLYAQMLSYGNTQANGVYIFGGDKSNAPPFSEALGGVQYAGSNTQLANTFDSGAAQSYTVGAAAIFGQVTGRVAGTATLTPYIDTTTRLSDLGGASGNGVRLGSIVLSDGATQKVVDLTGADSVGDVITRINNAGVGSITAGVDASGTAIELSTSGGDNITVNDVGAGSAAADLGILRTVGLGSGATLTGTSVQAKVTGLTALASINGGGLDLSSGLTITNGSASATLDFSTDTTVQDVLNRINNSGTGVRAEINAAGTGIDVENLVQGTGLTIGENGGNTATSLGIRTLSAATSVAALNGGKGLNLVAGNDLRITQSDGTNVDVDLSGATTVNDILNAINAAASAVGSGLTASLATNGNGIVLTDVSGGFAPTTVNSLNGSTAAQDLGLTGTSVGGVVTGTDVNPVYASGVFAHLANLRDALQRGDQAGITAAGTALQADYDRTVQAHGLNGARLQDLNSRQDATESQNTATTAALSNVQDVDYTEAITRFQTLQTALQASLQAAGKTLDLSLMDFLT